MRTFSAVIVSCVLALVSANLAAASVSEREGWQVIPTDQSYTELLENLQAAVGAENMGVVTNVGPTETAAQRGEEIPGNRVVGVFRNDFAVRAIRSNVAAMIEAPIRFYVTEDQDGTATLSWKTPSYVFSPYFDEGGEELRAIAEELDVIFKAIAARATDG